MAVLFGKKIEFAVNGGTAIKKLRAGTGDSIRISELPAPEKSGMIFDGWFMDAALKTPAADFVMPSENIVLFARWEPENKSSRTQKSKYMPRARFDFELKLKLSDDRIKSYYSAVRNRFRLYGARAYTKGKRENYQNGAELFGRFVFRNKSLLLCLPLALDDPRFADMKFEKIYLGKIPAFKELPFGFKVGSKKSVPIALKLVDAVAEDFRAEKKGIPPVDYVSKFRDDATFVERLGYGHLVGKKCLLSDAVLIDDRWADTVCRKRTGAKGTEPYVVTVGELSRLFSSGDRVSIGELHKKGLAENCDRLKVVEDKLLTKSLRVEAAGFSADAIKMIVLSGGEAVKLI